MNFVERIVVLLRLPIPLLVRLLFFFLLGPVGERFGVFAGRLSGGRGDGKRLFVRRIRLSVFRFVDQTRFEFGRRSHNRLLRRGRGTRPEDDALALWATEFPASGI